MRAAISIVLAGLGLACGPKTVHYEYLAPERYASRPDTASIDVFKQSGWDSSNDAIRFTRGEAAWLDGVLRTPVCPSPLRVQFLLGGAPISRQNFHREPWTPNYQINLLTPGFTLVARYQVEQQSVLDMDKLANKGLGSKPVGTAKDVMNRVLDRARDAGADGVLLLWTRTDNIAYMVAAIRCVGARR